MDVKSCRLQAVQLCTADKCTTHPTKTACPSETTRTRAKTGCALLHLQPHSAHPPTHKTRKPLPQPRATPQPSALCLCSTDVRMCRGPTPSAASADTG